MSELIGNLLDFARGRLGDGISINRARDAGLEPALTQVVLELKTTWPNRTINREMNIDRPVYCDAARMGQMLSNLLANAVTHGDPALPVPVRAETRGQTFEMSVTNHGETIPPHLIDKLFQPFVRGEAHSSKQGLGLGLYISSEIAKSHQGVLDVVSSDRKTTFTFRMPIQE